MQLLWITMMLGCGGDPEISAEPLPATFADPRIDVDGATPTYQLYRMEGRYDLPPTNLPGDGTPRTTFEVPLQGGKTSKRGQTTYTGQLPFDVGDDGRRFAPHGMTVALNGKEMPYKRGNPHWSVADDRLVVSTRLAPTGPVEVTWEDLRGAQERHTWSKAGLTAADFTRYTLTIDDDTRDGMLLPAPGSAEWDLKLPDDGAYFTAQLALERAPINTHKSDGALVTLSVVAGGETHAVGSQKLRGPYSTGFQPWTVSLDAFKGQDVTVRIATEPGGDNHFDYVFVGAPTVSGLRTDAVRHVVVIGIDTTRPDHFSFNGYGAPTTAAFDAIANTAVVFDQAWTPAPRTRPSFRTATTGRYPLDAVGAKNIGEVFQENGFATGAFVANVHLQPRFGFHKGFDIWSYDGQARATEQVDHALAFMRDNKDRDTYVFLHFMDPHVFYDAPSGYEASFISDPDPNLKRKLNRSEVYRLDARGALSDKQKRELEGRYNAELNYVSDQLGRFFAELDALGGRNLAIVHSDHGEEFWDHGGYEHNHTLYEEVTRALFVLRAGRGHDTPIHVQKPVTLADIAPTLFDFAGFEDLPELDGKSLRPLIDGDGGDGWDRPLGIAHMRYGHERWGVVWNQHKFIVHTRDGEEELYNLASDPKERDNLAATSDLAPYHKALALAHDLPIGAGWHIQVNADASSAPITFTLPRRALDAGLIDPEHVIETPNNQAWGEPAKHAPEEIGTTELSEDGLSFTWHPGTAPRDGVLYVLFGGEGVDPAGVVLERDGQPLPTTAVDGAQQWTFSRTKVTVRAGTVVVPPIGEAARMALLGEGGYAGAADMGLLGELGYVEEDDEGEGEDEEEEEPASGTDDTTDTEGKHP